MLTKNFYAFIGTSFMKGKTPHNFFGKTTLGKNAVPAIIDFEKYIFGAMTEVANSSTDRGVIFSSSIINPLSEDYVAVDALRFLTVSKPSDISTNFTHNSLEVSATYGVKNMDSSPANICSIFLSAQPNRDSIFLIDHTKLKTPITIKPGETKQITYTIRFNYPKAGA